jgi:aldehyde:ferredoxin oxidoreductase
MGLNLTLDDLMNYFAPRGRNLEKAFNALHTNLTREDDLPPKRFQEEPVKSGPYKGFKADCEKYNQMLNEFYEFWEWDNSTGLQTRKTLESIGLGKVANKLARYRKLV